MSGEGLVWVGFAACLLLSFMLSGMESGVFALSRVRIRQQVRAGRPSARVLYGFLENPENFLWTILVGNTIANLFILGWLVVILHDHLAGQRLGFIAVYGVAVFLFYTFCDLLPKMLFRSYPNRLCLALARPFRLAHMVLGPLVWLVESASGLLLRWRGGKVFTGRLFGNREELRVVMQESAQGFSSEERQMINRVLDLQVLTVRHAMTPLGEVISVPSHATVAELLQLARERHFTRFPVWEKRDGQQRIIGLVTLNALLYQPDPDPQRPVATFVKPALFLEENLRLEVALRRMQKGGNRLAIVLGPDRRELGILSLQDILKVVFGRVAD